MILMEWKHLVENKPGKLVLNGKKNMESIVVFTNKRSQEKVYKMYFGISNM